MKLGIPPEGQPLRSVRLGEVLCVYNLITGGAEIGGSKLPEQPELHSKTKTRLKTRLLPALALVLSRNL